MSRNRRKRPTWWMKIADEKRLFKLRNNRTGLHIAIVKALRAEMGYDAITEFQPIKHGRTATFRDIWIKSLSLAIRFFDNTPEGLETKDWFEHKARNMGVVFIDRESTFEDAMNTIQKGIFNQIEYLQNVEARKEQ